MLDIKDIKEPTEKQKDTLKEISKGRNQTDLEWMCCIAAANSILPEASKAFELIASLQESGIGKVLVEKYNLKDKE